MKKGISTVIVHSLLFIVALVMIFPLFWMLLLSLKEFPERYNTFIELITSPYTIANFSDTLNSDIFSTYFINSLFVGIVVTIGNLFFCLLVAYAFARKQFFAKEIFFATVLAVLIIPPHVIMIPLYRMMVEFGWVNSYSSLIIPWIVTPFGIFLLRQYITTIPSDIEDAARMDGAGQWYILFRIVMPLCKPILTVLAIYIFLGNWNSFLYPYLFTSADNYRTLPVGLTFYLGKQSIDWGHLMAGASISALPILVIFLFLQKKIIQGLTAGALKE